MEMFLLPLKTNIMIHAQILRDVTEEKTTELAVQRHKKRTIKKNNMKNLDLLLFISILTCSFYQDNIPSSVFYSIINSVTADDDEG